MHRGGGVRNIAPKPADSLSSSAPPAPVSPTPPPPPAVPTPSSPTPPQQPSSVGSSSGPVGNRKRGAITAIACVSCRRKKRKCNGARPTCDACSGLKATCVYEISPNERFQSDLRQKVRELERELSELKSTLGPLASEVSSEEREAVIRTARHIHQQQQLQFERNRPMSAPADGLLDGDRIGVSNVASSLIPPSSGGGLIGRPGGAHQAYSSLSGMVGVMPPHQRALFPTPVRLGSLHLGLSSDTTMSGLTSDARSQVSLQHQSAAEWLPDAITPDFPMSFDLGDDMNAYPNIPQGLLMPTLAQSSIRQLHQYHHVESRLGDFIEYIGAAALAPAAASVSRNTYAPITPHAHTYRVIKVPTHTLQPADNERFPPRELDTTRHLSNQWIIFRDKCRTMIAQGIATEDEILGTINHTFINDEDGLTDGEPERSFGADDVDVDLSTLFHPPRLSTAMTIFGWCAALVSKAEQIRTLPLSLRMATVYLAVLMLRWQISPTQSNYRAIPEWLRPTPIQIFEGHRAAIDLIPWPLVREGLCKNPQDFIMNLTLHTSFDWFWSDIACFTSSTKPDHPQRQHDDSTSESSASRGEAARGKRRATGTASTYGASSTSGGGGSVGGGGGGGGGGKSGRGSQTTVSPLFKSHVADLRNWVLDAGVLQRFPEMEGRAYLRQAGSAGPGVNVG